MRPFGFRREKRSMIQAVAFLSAEASMPSSDMKRSEHVAVDLDLVRHLLEVPPGRRAVVVLGGAAREGHPRRRAGEVIGQICGQRVAGHTSQLPGGHAFKRDQPGGTGGS